MDANKLADRVTELLKEDSENDLLHWWWLSFADESGFKGALVIKARGFTEALLIANLTNLNPQGEVKGAELPIDAVIPEEWKNKLISKAEIEQMGGAMKF